MSDAVQGREVARRLFAAEFDDATLSYSEGDDERAPNYVVTPTGARVNRLFAVGALTEVEQVNDEIVRGRVADPTGVFVTYAGQYQPDAMGFLDRTTPPCFVSLTGKARTYQPEDSDRIFTSVRPESLNEVDADTRDRWVVSAAEATLERVATMAAALKFDVRGDDLTAALEIRGVDGALAQGVALAVDHYEPTEHYLEGIRRMAVQALELVAGERDAVEAPTAAPNEPGSRTLGSLPMVAAASAAPGDAAAAVSPDSVEDSSTESPSEASVGPEPEAQSAAGDDVKESEPAATESEESEPATDDGPEAVAGDVADELEEVAGGSEDVASDVDEPKEVADAVEDDTESEGDVGAESEDAEDESSGTLGDFAADASAGDSEAETGDPAVETESPDTDLDGDEMYEIDDEERAEIEEEYGTEFATGNEVDAPGEADIDVPDVDELESQITEESGTESDGEDAASEDESDVVSDDEGDAASEDEIEASDAGAEADTEREVPADVDLEDAAVSVMADLDDGDGADHETVVATVVDEYGADPDAVEDAIQEALMGGKCYEPTEGTLKSI
ncbi:hypothetical protein [Halobellus captivus]|uniref:hypothetical protein n=1 Tax=Halobellus captivus TaxID=2592614 RepID=UPI0037446069